MKKAVLKERLEKAKAVRQLHDEEMKAMSRRVQDLESRLSDEQAVSPPRVELALIKAGTQAKNDKDAARKQVIRNLQEAMRMALHDTGRGEEWKNCIAWVETWRKENFL